MILPTTATVAGLALAWLVTYLVHSTVTLGLAWGASRVARRRERTGHGTLSLGIEETVWKLALVGALATATLQVGWLALGVGGAAAAPGAEAAPIVAMSVETPAPAARSQAASAIPASPAAGSARTSLGAVPAGSSSHPMLDSVAATLPGWQRLLLSAWLAGGLLGLGLLAFTWTRLRRRLAGREVMAEGDARQALDRLMERSQDAGASPGQVRLTRTGELPVPVALGVGEREICVPRDVLDDLEPREREGLLAHELAHLLRRDPLWLLAARTMEAVLFLQPLNRVARRRLQEIAELSADAWAVSQTGDRLGLARCLERVAGSLVHRRALTALPVPGMASRQAGLAERVRRILSSDDATARPARWVLGVAAGVLALTLLVPGLTPPRLEAGVQEGPIGEVQEREAQEVDRARQLERETERRVERDRERAEHEAHDYDHDHDFDFDHDDIGPEIEAAMAEVMESLVEVRVESLAIAMEARHEALAEVERALAQAEAGDFDHPEMTPQQREEMRRELTQAREELSREMALSDREMEELHRELAAMQHEIRRELDRAMADMPSREELARIAEEARREAMEAMPSEEELRRLRDEARREAEEHRHHLRDERREMERHREQLRRERHEMRRQRGEMRHQMQEQMERQEVERRRQLERTERQLQREIERLEADGSAKAREVVGDLRESLGDLREERVELEAERQELERELEQEMAEMERDLAREMVDLEREMADMDLELEEVESDN